MKNNLSRNKILTYIANELIKAHNLMQKKQFKEDKLLREYTRGRIAQLELIWFDLTGEWLPDQYKEETEEE